MMDTDHTADETPAVDRSRDGLRLAVEPQARRRLPVAAQTKPNLDAALDGLKGQRKLARDKLVAAQERHAALVEELAHAREHLAKAEAAYAKKPHARAWEAIKAMRLDLDRIVLEESGAKARVTEIEMAGEEVERAIARTLLRDAHHRAGEQFEAAVEVEIGKVVACHALLVEAQARIIALVAAQRAAVDEIESLERTAGVTREPCNETQGACATKTNPGFKACGRCPRRSEMGVLASAQIAIARASLNQDGRTFDPLKHGASRWVAPIADPGPAYPRKPWM